jgi:hypothetical protein
MTYDTVPLRLAEAFSFDWQRLFSWSLSAELPFEYGLILLFEGKLNDKVKMM